MAMLHQDHIAGVVLAVMGAAGGAGGLDGLGLLRFTEWPLMYLGTNGQGIGCAVELGFLVSDYLAAFLALAVVGNVGKVEDYPGLHLAQHLLHFNCLHGPCTFCTKVERGGRREKDSGNAAW